MAMLAPSPRSPAGPPGRAARHLYRRPPEPVYFPTSEEVPETNRHLELRTLLYLILKRELADRAAIGSDQFVYWDPTNAKRCLAPDAFVRLGLPHDHFEIWKTWERGAPDLGVEVASRSDEAEDDWDDKLARYRAAGIGEVVRFDPRDRAAPIRVWDLVDGDLIERAANDPDLCACESLGLWWIVEQHPTLGPTLRLARDRAGQDLLPTPDDVVASAREAEAKAREAEAKAREAEAKAHEANARLEAEVAALRAQLGSVKKARKKPAAGRKKG